MIDYRHPSETPAFWFAALLVLGITAAIALPTLCLVPLLLAAIVLVAYQANQSHHRLLLQEGTRVSAQRTPEVWRLAQDCVRRLQPGDVDVVVVPAREVNAYTFGLSSPKVVVLYSSLFKLMDADELRFVLGHELGHVALGHTWLNTLLGGMAGMPTSFFGAVLFTFTFRGWNRACEYSADRAGLLACGSLHKAITALVQLAVGDIRSQAQFEQALAALDRQDEVPVNQFGELLSSHPLIIHRIEELQRYAASPEYRALQARVGMPA